MSFGSYGQSSHTAGIQDWKLYVTYMVELGNWEETKFDSIPQSFDSIDSVMSPGSL